MTNHMKYGGFVLTDTGCQQSLSKGCVCDSTNLICICIGILYFLLNRSVCARLVHVSYLVG